MAANNSELPRICVLGSLNIDLVSYVPHHPAPGETLTSNSFHVSPGGKVSAQSSSPPPPNPFLPPYKSIYHNTRSHTLSSYQTHSN